MAHERGANETLGVRRGGVQHGAREAVGKEVAGESALAAMLGEVADVDGDPPPVGLRDAERGLALDRKDRRGWGEHRERRRSWPHQRGVGEGEPERRDAIGLERPRLRAHHAQHARGLEARALLTGREHGEADELAPRVVEEYRYWPPTGHGTAADADDEVFPRRDRRGLQASPHRRLVYRHASSGYAIARAFDANVEDRAAAVAARSIVERRHCVRGHAHLDAREPVGVGAHLDLAREPGSTHPHPAARHRLTAGVGHAQE